MQGHKNQVTIEAWRGVAALLVLATHWAPLLGGHQAWTAYAFAGVDLFFVISGFVFAPTICGNAVGSLKGFAARRFFRIYPAYALALALYAAIAAHQNKPLLFLPEHALMMHVQNREMAFYYNPPFWSLPAEVAFYALVPILSSLSRAPWAFRGWIIVVAIAVALRICVVTGADPIAQNIAFVLAHHLPGLFIEFLFGVAAWRWNHGAETEKLFILARSRALSIGLTIFGLLLYAAGNYLFNILEKNTPGAWINGQTGILAAAGLALILASSARRNSDSGSNPRLAGKYSMLICVWAGRLSYGVYLLHGLWGLAIPSLTSLYGNIYAGVIAGLGLLLTSWIVYRWIEDPARKFGAEWSARQVTHQRKNT